MNVAEIPFLDGKRISFDILSTLIISYSIVASVIKDAGDDPDVTNGAIISARVRLIAGENFNTPDFIEITGVLGVGPVTEPGLTVGVVRPEINTVTHQKIRFETIGIPHKNIPGVSFQCGAAAKRNAEITLPDQADHYFYRKRG